MLLEKKEGNKWKAKAKEMQLKKGKQDKYKYARDGNRQGESGNAEVQKEREM